MEQPPAHDVKTALRAAYEAGKVATRHFDHAADKPPGARTPKTDRDEWHH